MDIPENKWDENSDNSIVLNDLKKKYEGKILSNEEAAELEARIPDEKKEEFVKNLLDKNKKIYVCGLDGDFKRQKFGNILDLIPLCDKVEKLSSLCAICRDGTPGIFSQRISLEKEQTVVGANNYIPVCRNCYEK
jgi:thymidine kinase